MSTNPRRRQIQTKPNRVVTRSILTRLVMVFAFFCVLGSTVTLAATKETALFDFTLEYGNGGYFPVSTLVMDQAGNLYGITYEQLGLWYWGATVFKLSPGASGWTATTTFTWDYNNVPDISTALAVDQAGNLYGEDGGGLYELIGATYQVYLVPGLGSGTITLDQAGNIYGWSYNGAESFVFELSPGQNGWTENVLYEFPQGGGSFTSTLVLGSSGEIYGNGYSGSAGLFKLSKVHGTWTLTTLYSYPYNDAGPLSADAKGNLYTITGLDGGQNVEVMKFTKGHGVWNAKILYTFQTPPSGLNWRSPLLAGKYGSVYGTTRAGGEGHCSDADQEEGCGTVFKIGPVKGIWTETILHEFNPKLDNKSNPHDGASPYGGLIFDASGKLVGTTAHGGDVFKGEKACPNGCGTVFEIAP
jgi:hypothetical protein